MANNSHKNGEIPPNQAATAAVAVASTMAKPGPPPSPVQTVVDGVIAESQGGVGPEIDEPTAEELAEERALGCFEMLLRLAGRLPDELLAQCRDWVAAGNFTPVASAVAFSAASTRSSLVYDDVELLSEILTEAGADTSVLSQIDQAEIDPMPYFRFSEHAPGTEEGKITDSEVADPGGIDAAIVAAAAQSDGLLGLWRSWRYPGTEAPWPPPRRVFIAETESVDTLVEATADLQQALRLAGEDNPQVEAYPTGVELPSYQTFARANSTLLWSSTDDPGLDIVPVFDGVDPVTGPYYNPDHPRLEPSERDKVVSYLNAGEPLLVTTALMDDVVDRARTNAVPMNFRTDGTWIWTDVTTYYLEVHDLAPEQPLLDHIRALDYVPPVVDGVGIHRAMEVLNRPAEQEPVWTYDGSSSSGAAIDQLDDEGDDDDIVD